MEGHYNKFIIWLEENKLIDKDISTLKKRTISTFLNSLKKYQTDKDRENGKEQEAVSPKTRNNYRATLSSLFSQLEQDDILEFNIVEKIVKLKSTPKKDKPFSANQIIEIRKYLDENDPYLRTFIQFISYAFLRNIEVCRLKVGDIELESKRLYVKSKTETQAVVPIIKELNVIFEKMNLSKYSANEHLITKFEKPSLWEIKRSK